MVFAFTQIPRLLAGLAVLALSCATPVVAGDPFTYVPVLHEQAQQGDPRAQTRLAQRYADGVGVPQNYARAIDWYRRAARQGYAPAREALAALGVPPVVAEPGPPAGSEAAGSHSTRKRRGGDTVNINIHTGGPAGYSRGGRDYGGYYVITHPRRHRKSPGHPGHGKPVPLPGSRSGKVTRGLTVIPPGR
jgi:hypothetical protein